MGEICYQMTAKEMPATEKEIQDIEDEDADEMALSQAIEAFVAPTRARRKRTASSKVVDNTEQARQLKIAKSSGSSGGRRGGDKV
jgi:hypothetical protein